MVYSALSSSVSAVLCYNNLAPVFLFAPNPRPISTIEQKRVLLFGAYPMEGKVNKFKLLQRKFKFLKREHEKELSGKVGIYAIINITNNHCYVGQSKDIRSRWKGHRGSLNRGSHGNAYLQNAWNFYKEQSFKFAVLEVCNYEELNDKEQYWIERLNPEYNIARNVFEWSAYKASDNDIPDGYVKPGESFQRPQWHLWVYGGHRHKQGE